VFLTIGSGAEYPYYNFGNMYKGFYRDTDVNDPKKGRVVFPKIWNGMNEDTMISLILGHYAGFSNDVEYELFPDKGELEYNSNGFINGLLKASGMSIQKPYSKLTGWNQPVPQNKF